MLQEDIVSFSDTLTTYYLWLYGVGHMVKDYSYNERGNPLRPLDELLFLISRKYYII